MSYQEVAKIRIRATGLTLKALPNGSSVGGTCWHIELSGQSILYALDLNDHESAIAAPLKQNLLKGATLMITNAHISPM